MHSKNDTKPVRIALVFFLGCVVFGLGILFLLERKRVLKYESDAQHAAQSISAQIGKRTVPRQKRPDRLATKEPIAIPIKKASMEETTSPVRQEPAGGINPQLVRAGEYGISYITLQSYYKEVGVPASSVSAFEKTLLEESPTLAAYVDTLRNQKDLVLQQRFLADINRRILPILGEEAVRQFDEFMRTSRIRRVTAEVAVAATYSSQPLTDAEQRFVTDVLINASSANAPLSRLIAVDTVDWSQALSKAAERLSNSKIEILKAIATKYSFDREFKRQTSASSSIPLPIP